ncbi:hypothetical protein [Cellulomonas endometrii]|uniref:hypothetical protein n=1 Tax=Cellulomonas endometrii TaxID=3036301 RepID=UPI0024ACAD41|nr:hypothetical protein [Cellulomonas endometrii]
MAGHVVTSPAVQVIAGGRAFFLERGAVLPGGVAEDVLEHLLANGLIETVAESEPGDTGENGDGDGDEANGDSDESPKRPRGNAGLAKWVEYAQALGREVPEDADVDAVKALVDAPASE